MESILFVKSDREAAIRERDEDLENFVVAYHENQRKLAETRAQLATKQATFDELQGILQQTEEGQTGLYEAIQKCQIELTKCEEKCGGIAPYEPPPAVEPAQSCGRHTFMGGLSRIVNFLGDDKLVAAAFNAFGCMATCYVFASAMASVSKAYITASGLSSATDAPIDFNPKFLADFVKHFKSQFKSDGILYAHVRDYLNVLGKTNYLDLFGLIEKGASFLTLVERMNVDLSIIRGIVETFSREKSYTEKLQKLLKIFVKTLVERVTKLQDEFLKKTTNDEHVKKMQETIQENMKDMQEKEYKQRMMNQFFGFLSNSVAQAGGGLLANRVNQFIAPGTPPLLRATEVIDEREKDAEGLEFLFELVFTGNLDALTSCAFTPKKIY